MKMRFSQRMEKGFTLIEVSISATLMIIVLMGATTYFSSARRELQEANLKNDAWRVMTDRLEYALALDYESVLDSTLLENLLVENGTHLQVNGTDGYRTTEVEVLYSSANFGAIGPGSDEDECFYCDIESSPGLLAIEYSGDSCEATNHSQSAGSVSCTGDPAQLTPVEILVSDSQDPSQLSATTWYYGLVDLGGIFEVDASSVMDDQLSDDLYVFIQDPFSGMTLQTVKFHSSCSEPLYENDQFGALILKRFVSASGNLICGIGNTGDDVVGDSNLDQGLTFSHFDFDTIDGSNPLSTHLSDSETDKHTHEYDDKYDETGVDFLHPHNDHVNLFSVVEPDQKFKIIAVNTHLSQAGRLAVNHTYNPENPATYIPVLDYANEYTNASNSIDAPPPSTVSGFENFSSLPVFSFAGVEGSTQLTNFGVYFDVNALNNPTVGGPYMLHPTNTAEARYNVPGINGEWRNGSLVFWAVEVDENGIDNFSIDMSNGQPHITDGLLWEGFVFWHWDGPSFNEAEWHTYDAENPEVTDDSEGGTGDFSVNHGKVEICHVPPGNPANSHTIEVSQNAVQAHLNHGCYLGPCESEGCGYCEDPMVSPGALRLRYNGQNCEDSHHAQNDNNVSCTDYAAFTSPVRILVTDKKKSTNPSANVWFDGLVELNQEFEVSAGNAGRTSLGRGTYVYIFESSEEILLQGIGFHTSCSDMLFPGDQFGSIVLEEFFDESGTIVCSDGGDPGGGDPGDGNDDDDGGGINWEVSNADYLIKVTVKFAWRNPENDPDSVSLYISPQRSWKWN